jgi:ribosome-associated heat shock protein Hsp15
MRVDKWLWAARFFKTRSLAQQAIEAGKVKLAGERIKPAQALRAGDELSIRIGDYQWVIVVKALSERRGPAEQARKLYEETAASVAERQRLLDLRRLSPEPDAGRLGRPTKRDRRRLDSLRNPQDE